MPQTIAAHAAAGKSRQTKQRNPTVPLSKNDHLLRWVEKMAELARPDRIHWVDGSQEENDALCAEMVESGTFIKLNEKLWPGCYYARSDASDVARVEDRTFICSLSKDNAGPTNNWENPYEMRKKLKGLFNGSMRGRTMYVLPFSMGPVGSPMSQNRRAAHRFALRRRQHAHHGAHRHRGVRGNRQRRQARGSLHALRRRAARSGQKDVPWPCNKEKYIVHFPETREIWSYGSGYGGNALLGKKCFALRIASNIARDEGWMAEHMLILGVEDPAGRKDLRRRRFPQRLRQNQFRHADSAQGFRGLEESGRSATTSPGFKPDDKRLVCAPSIRKPASSAWRPALQQKDQSERHGHARQEHHFHQRRADARRRRVVGRHDRRAARPSAWTGKASSGLRRSPKKPAPRPRIPMRASPRPLRNVPPSIPPGKIPTACRSAPSFSAAAAPPPCRWSIRLSTGAPASISAPPWARR